MDPNTTLRMIEELLDSSEVDHDEVESLCQDLSDWLKKGGYAPKWSIYPRAHAHYGVWHVHNTVKR